MPHARWWSLFAALSLLSGIAHADVKAGKAALLKGNWAAAEKEFTAAPAAEKAAALLGLAELYRTTGKYEPALKAAHEAAALPGGKDDGPALAGEILRETGRHKEAVPILVKALTANPKNHRARVALGITYKQMGQEVLAQKQLQQLVDGMGNGQLDKENARHLYAAALAARHLDQVQEANGWFRDAVAKDPNLLEANLDWADLFLYKYNAANAEESYKDVLKLNPNHPRAILGMAQITIIQSYDVKQAHQLIDAALKQNPNMADAFVFRAALFLNDEDFAPAEAMLAKALAINPAHLEALAELAASKYLQDDKVAYEATKTKALTLNKNFSDFFPLMTEFVDRAHRYHDAIALNREAVKRDPKNPRALLALGMNLLRMGVPQEKEGLKYLAQAWDLDPFDVKNLNTLNLYEEVIAKEYDTFQKGLFIYRFPKKERAVLERVVPPFIERAWAIYTKKYGFTPQTPITVELYTERQHYSARTIGLPDLGAQGTCFGQLVTAMSPSSGEANWEEVLWHEFGHVFHIQMTNNRTPRWFTEGLAEYETNVERPEWKREHAKSIFLSMKRGNLWKIEDLSSAFTRPDRPNGVVLAYQQSSMVIHYIAETYGFPKVVEAMKLYAAGKRDPEVFQAITGGKTLAQANEEFRAFLVKKYPHYAEGMLIAYDAYDATKAKADADSKPGDAEAQATYAAALLGQKDLDGAKAAAQKAVALDAKNALGHYVLADIALAAGDPKTAKAEYEAVLAAGRDGYEMRMNLAKIAAQADDTEAAIQHLNAAKRWDPDESDPYQALMQIYQEAKRTDDLLKEAMGFVMLEEHQGAPTQLLMERLSAAERYEEVVKYAPMALAIDPMPSFVHQEYGRALYMLKKHADAVRELEIALAAGAKKPAPLHAMLAQSYLALGDKAKAKAAAIACLGMDPKNPDALAVLKQVGS